MLRQRSTVALVREAALTNACTSPHVESPSALSLAPVQVKLMQQADKTLERLEVDEGKFADELTVQQQEFAGAIASLATVRGLLGRGAGRCTCTPGHTHPTPAPGTCPAACAVCERSAEAPRRCQGRRRSRRGGGARPAAARGG
jgi:hypothetical protein